MAGLFRSRRALPFFGPWELFEVLDDEFRELDPELPPRPADIWRFRDADIVSRTGVRERIEDLNLPPTRQAGAWDRFAFLAQGRLGRLARMLTRRKGKRPSGPTACTSSDCAAINILNTTLDCDPVDVVRVCWRYLDGERGRSLRDNIPDLTEIVDPERVRERFNRLVLELAFKGFVHSASNRAVAELYRDAHERERARERDGSPRARWALCLSGGGIRSASFALGVIQGLARQRVLRRIDYLSTVSGGGYIGSWLTAWMSRAGRDAVLSALGEPPQPDDGQGSKCPLDPEPPSIHHLRSFSNYLAPKKGTFGADVWTLVATITRNLILNWLVVLPVLAAALVMPLLAAAAVAHPPAPGGVRLRDVALLLAIGLAGAIGGVQFVHTRRPDGGDSLLECDAASPEAATSRRVAKARSERAFLVRCLLPIVLATAALSTLWAWMHPEVAGGSVSNGFDFFRWPAWVSLVTFGIVAHTAGWLWATARLGGTKGFSAGLLEGVAVVITGGAVGGVIFFAAGWIGSASVWIAAHAGKSFDAINAAIGGNANAAVYSMLAFPSFIASLVVAGFLYVGVTSRKQQDEEREWSSRYSAWLMLTAFGWLALSGIVVLSGVVTISLERMLASAAAAVVSGSAAALLGKSEDTPDEQKPGTPAKPGVAALVRKLALAFAAPAGVLLTLVTLAATVSRIVGAAVTWLGARGGSAPGAVLLMGVLLLSVGAVFSAFIDVNKFSLHAMYRARLIRAYLAASRRPGTRYPNPFTGFDPADNLNMHCLCDNVPHTDRVRAPGSHDKPPIHILNLALNLTSVNNLEWQDRKARSFTISQYHAGAWGLGYRRTRLTKACDNPHAYYGGDRGITLGTAMAISGAAASPSMGYHSSPAVTFLMALFNARLGWWLGNPGWAGGRKTFHQSNPRRLVSPIFAELLGLTTDSERLVYLSDGGHFENLGLYEMVLRRCGMIVVVDASGDAHCTLEDLGNAIRKIRIDLGVPITFDGFDINARGSGGELPADGHHIAYGHVRYSEVDEGAEDGELIYVKPALTGDEPRDVLAYAKSSVSFPHEATSDQFFSEAQLESYRALGEHSVERLVKDVAADPTGMRTIGPYYIRPTELVPVQRQAFEIPG